ncbi:MAG: OmpH family outer membrane protein [Chitinophagaceae bacterium]|nr:OmpH family outer membrane protein [Chitinophagaceae bacterium]
MKNLSLVLNIVLLAAVGYLYYYDFSGKKAKDVAAKINNTYMSTDSNGRRPALAYVDLDSLNENITYIKERRSELDAEMKKIEKEQEDGYKGLQAQRDNFLRRGAAITEAEAQSFQDKLLQQQQQIDSRKQQMSQDLNGKSFNIMEEIKKHLRNFLTEYNKEKNYMYIFTTGTGLDYMVYKDSTLNITADVIKGMNEKMEKEKTKSASKQ